MIIKDQKEYEFLWHMEIIWSSSSGVHEIKFYWNVVVIAIGSFIYILSVAVFMLQQQGLVVSTEATWPAKP